MARHCPSPGLTAYSRSRFFDRYSLLTSKLGYQNQESPDQSPPDVASGVAFSSSGMSIRISVGFNKQAHGACNGEKFLLWVLWSRPIYHPLSHSLFPPLISFPPIQMPSRGQYYWSFLQGAQGCMRRRHAAHDAQVRSISRPWKLQPMSGGRYNGCQPCAAAKIAKLGPRYLKSVGREHQQCCPVLVWGCQQLVLRQLCLPLRRMWDTGL